MASFVVDGLVVPISVTGDPALNFCNTRAGWGSARPKEYVSSHAHLAVWARENGVIATAQLTTLGQTATADPAGAARALARALAFRSALYAVLVRSAGPEDRGVVNAEVRRAARGFALSWPDPVPLSPARWELMASPRLDLPLLGVAWAAAALLTSPVANQVCACPGTGCGWLFADPRGRRRWCSMTWCGNRAKVRRYAQRRREH